MKRLAGLGAAALAAIIPLSEERQDPECKDRQCIGELVAKVPEQAHGTEEPPTYEASEDWVDIPSSPPARVERGSAYHLEWIKENGPIK
jgi:hypothetical protein